MSPFNLPSYQNLENSLLSESIAYYSAFCYNIYNSSAKYYLEILFNSF